MKKTSSRYVYTVTARRSNGQGLFCGETLFFCNSPTQGPAMIPLAWSMAYRFDSRANAKATAEQGAIKWRGLANWKVERKNRAEIAP